MQPKPVSILPGILLTYLFLILFIPKTMGVNDRFRFGLMAGPGLSWLKPKDKDLRIEKVGYSMNYGLMFEYYFHQNYGISTGLFGGMDAGSISGRDSFEKRPNSIVKVTEKYSYQSVQIPIMLKLRTNEIRKFTVFGEIGFTLNGVVSSRATFSEPVPVPAGSLLQIEKENILRKDNALSTQFPGFRSGFFDFRILAGAGFEYAFSGRTALMFGLYYQNGFVNMLKDQDPRKEALLMRNFQFRTGIFF